MTVDCVACSHELSLNLFDRSDANVWRIVDRNQKMKYRIFTKYSIKQKYWLSCIKRKHRPTDGIFFFSHFDFFVEYKFVNIKPDSSVELNWFLKRVLFKCDKLIHISMYTNVQQMKEPIAKHIRWIEISFRRSAHSVIMMTYNDFYWNKYCLAFDCNTHSVVFFIHTTNLLKRI